MAQQILIHDATIVTADQAGSIHYDAALLVQDRRIAAICPSAEILARYPGAERVDGRGRGVFPGRANASIGQLGPFTADAALAEARLARIAALHAHWDGRNDGRVRVGLAAWAPDLCSPELLARLGKLRSELDVLATIHLNQVWGEV